MATEKIWVEHFNILEYQRQMGIELPIKGEPIHSAAFLYDGRNCAILIKNQEKAYILTNIAYDLRAKLLAAKPLIVIEMTGDEFYQGYPVEVTSVSVPYPDNLQATIDEMLEKIEEKYGAGSVQKMIDKLWPEEAKK